jgi:hypothetical protein
VISIGNRLGPWVWLLTARRTQGHGRGGRPKVIWPVNAPVVPMVALMLLALSQSLFPLRASFPHVEI